MEYVEAILSLLAGLGALLIGFKLLSDNIEKLANSGLKKLFNKTSNNRFIGVGIGAIVTAIIQSSSASTVMIVGFVNAGVMTLFQATAMIMGANIGTTITAQIAALSSFDIGVYLAMLAFVGIFGGMFAKKEKTKTIFMALAGLGLVFLSLDLMSGAMETFKQSDVFESILTSITNPFLLLLIGVALTAILQSSSAVTSIIISMAIADITIGNGGNSVLFVILGSNIGTCVTALLSSIGASVNARRASLIHLMFNVFGSIIFFIVLISWSGFNETIFGTLFKAQETQIAMFHTFFNVVVTLLFLPFINVFVKISTWLVRDKKEENAITYLDDRFLNTPGIAIEQVAKETNRLGQVAKETLNASIDAFLAKNVDASEAIIEKIQRISGMNDALLNYLLKLTTHEVTESDEKYISAVHRILIDFTRQAEIADNMMKYTRHRVDNGLEFSQAVYDGIEQIRAKLNEQFDLLSIMFENPVKKNLKRCDAIEEEIDHLRDELIDGHIKRLEEGTCSPSSNTIFISLVSNLERAGDHLNYVAHSLVEATK